MEECIPFCFLLHNVLKISILYAKYYFYAQQLFNNKILNLYAWTTQFKQTLKIEEKICINNNNEEKWINFHFINEKL